MAKQKTHKGSMSPDSFYLHSEEETYISCYTCRRAFPDGGCSVTNHVFSGPGQKQYWKNCKYFTLREDYDTQINQQKVEKYHRGPWGVTPPSAPPMKQMEKACTQEPNTSESIPVEKSPQYHLVSTFQLLEQDSRLFPIGTIIQGPHRRRGVILRYDSIGHVLVKLENNGWVLKYQVNQLYESKRFKVHLFSEERYLPSKSIVQDHHGRIGIIAGYDEQARMHVQFPDGEGIYSKSFITDGRWKVLKICGVGGREY